MDGGVLGDLYVVIDGVWVMVEVSDTLWGFGVWDISDKFTGLMEVGDFEGFAADEHIGWRMIYFLFL